MNEIWKEIPEFPQYEASTLGNIRRKGWKNNRKFSLDRDGYLIVLISINNKLYNKKVHRLIASTFLPKKDGKNQVNHINENKKDNRVINLEWVTSKENVNHSHKKIYHDSKVKFMKPIIQYSLSGEFIKEWESARKAALDLNLRNNSHIAECCNGKLKQCKGFIWRWKTENYPLKIEPIIFEKQPRELVMLRNYLKRRDYILDEDNRIAYYTNSTKRAKHLEKTPTFYKYEPIEVELTIKIKKI